MLNLMENFPLGGGFQRAGPARDDRGEEARLRRHAALRRRPAARAPVPVAALLDKRLAKQRAALIDTRRAARQVEPSVLDRVTTAVGGDTIYLSAIDRHGNIVSLIQSVFEGFGTAIVPRAAGFSLHNRGALFTLEEDPREHAGAAQARSTRSSRVHGEGRHRIGFGIMGGFNQARRTRSSSPTSSTTGSTSSRRLKPDGSRSLLSMAPT